VDVCARFSSKDDFVRSGHQALLEAQTFRVAFAGNSRDDYFEQWNTRQDRLRTLQAEMHALPEGAIPPKSAHVFRRPLLFGRRRPADMLAYAGSERLIEAKRAQLAGCLAAEAVERERRLLENLHS
jgi:hypothetical protein